MELIGEILKLTVLAGLALAGVLVIMIWKKGLATKVTYLRFLVQAVSMVAVFYLFTYPVWQLIILIVIFVLPLFLGRFFCGWICPFALIMDAITLIRKAVKVRYLINSTSFCITSDMCCFLSFCLFLSCCICLTLPPPSTRLFFWLCSCLVLLSLGEF